MSNTVNLGNGKWAIKDSELLGYSLTDDAELIALTLDVSRASSGTRVNASGLIETVEKILSGDKVTNGDFSNGTTDWSNPSYGGNNSATISIDNGSLKVQKDNNLDWRSAFVSQDLINYTFGKEYKVQFSLKDGNTNGGEVFVRSLFDSSNSAIVEKTLTDDWVQYTEYFTPDRGDSISFGVVEWHEAGSGQYYFIDNVSVIEVNRDNLARIDYTDSVEGVLLTEPQSTNLNYYSEDFSQWSVENSSIVPNTTISPDGTQNATTWNVNTTNAKIQRAIGSLTIGEEYTVSFYIKAESPMDIGIGGIVTATPTISVTTEWQRFEMTQTSSSTVRYPQLKYAGDLGTLYIWGAQLEESSHATSIMPTYGEIASRAGDVINNGGEAINFNSAEGVLFAEIAALSDDETSRSIRISDGSSLNYVAIRFNNGGSNRIYTRVNVGSSANYFYLDSSHNITDMNKIAIRYKDSDFATFINGVKVSSQTSGSLFPVNTLDTLSVHGSNETSEPFYGKTKNIQVFKEALTDAQLITLTTI